MSSRETKFIILIGEILTDIKRGIYTQHIYYLDGSIEERKIPKGPVFIPPIPFNFY